MDGDNGDRAPVLPANGTNNPVDESVAQGGGGSGRDEIDLLAVVVSRESLLDLAVAQSGHRLLADVAAADEPLIIGLDRERRDEPDQRGVAGKMPTTAYGSAPACTTRAQPGRWSALPGGHGTSIASSRRRSQLPQNSRPSANVGNRSECRGQTHARSPRPATPPNRVRPVRGSRVQPAGSSRHAFSIHLAAPRIALIGVA